MIKVITFGVFDLLHYGHINLFRRAKAFGDVLVVAVQNDFDAVKNKPNIVLHDCLKERCMNILKCDYVANVIEYSQIDEDIKQIAFDILVVGGDQKNKHFLKAIEWCLENNKEVIHLSRTEGISSSSVREDNYNLNKEPK